ncbi:MAG: LytTR family DNA-binding domain-containing protein [Bacteroidota bacterium]
MSIVALKAVIVDDEPISRKLTRQFAERTGLVEVIHSLDGTDALQEVMTTETIDLLFLDIEMPGVSGIEFVRTTDDLPQIIFTTQHQDFALEAFDHDVTDYLIKPIIYSRFLKAVMKARSIKEMRAKKISAAVSEDRKEIFVRVQGRILKVQLADILFLEAYGDYVKVYLEDQKLVVHATLTRVEQELPERDFIRIHRRFVVRINRIHEVLKNEISIGKHVIPVSKSHRAHLMTRLRIIS